ncbi:DUF2218 domain-containing protein [Lichenifustis flavocetrariae]|uniref:DUF2218 domain-containing protein n=1 Tax=Lichenifustis flavocetrariae TaxID=2949735 RepID=A0AA42CJX1_9HYPH|nr:DUF2218 domain-containing protein [Lichenifustis flavocetrariae]MCW6509949.1 DUF2218 domain-containing protein [Lichenifustis flavocetrariae]
MNSLYARVATEHASRYLQQLCKHWNHRFDVTFDADHGTVHLPGADLGLLAQPDALVMTLSSPDDTDLIRLGGVVDAHLSRFAFRETLAIVWSGTEAVHSAS